MTGWVLTIVFLAGLVAITIGAAMIALPAGLIVGGVLAVIASWLLRIGERGPARPTD